MAAAAAAVGGSSVLPLSSAVWVNCSGRGSSTTRDLSSHHERQKFLQPRDGCFNVLLGGIGLATEVQSGRGVAKQQQQQFTRGDVCRWFQAPSRSGKRLKNCTCNCAWEETFADVDLTALIRKPALDSKLSSQNHANQFEKLNFWIITVSTSDELLAAATLRAQFFYSYPKFKSTDAEGLGGIKARLKHEFNVRDLMKLRVTSEFERDTKMQNLNMNVKCLLAVCEESSHEEMLLSSQEERNSLMAPPDVASSAFSSKTAVAIGTLDIQDGTGTKADVDVNTVTFQLFTVANTQKKKYANRRQISEPGQGHNLLSISSNGNTPVKHGYIFNLCVTETVRRRGVATALMKEAVQVAQQMQLQILYVHVDADNVSGLALYQKLGYVVEEEESFDVARRFQRPRRILLSYRFQ